jgi:4-hydroxy-tetrahydrodipicolinate reductase
MAIRVGVFGAGGRMGRTVCEAVCADDDLELVAGVDPNHAGDSVCGIDVAGEPRAMADTHVDVVVDFTVVDAARNNVSWAALHGVHAVVGTTGFNDDDFALFADEFTRSACVIAPNFAIGAVLMMRFAELAAPWFDSAEIIELHHDAKADAPSGTALATATRMAASSAEWAPDPTRTEVVPGARGGSGPAGIRLHSVRMRGMVAHQEVILGALGQTLILRQDSYDRTSFMPGVLLAVRRVGELPEPLVVGLEHLLFDR